MKRFIIAGVLVFLAILVVTFPARVAYNWFAPPDVTLTGISGSVWSGSAAEGLAAGAYVRNLSWKLEPMSLLSGKLEFATSSEPAAGSITGNVAIGLDGALTMSGLSGSLPLDLAHPTFQQEGLSGDIRLQFDNVVIRNGLPAEMEGSVTVFDFYVPQLSVNRLGDFRSDLRTTSEGIVGTVDDVAGDLDIDGATITIAPDGSYTLIGDVRAKPGAPPSVAQQLQQLPQADQPGYRWFRFDGKL